ncbi:MAG: hypothetical protein ACE5GY_00695 [Thermodesulfobacteriota bacterium]
MSEYILFLKGNPLGLDIDIKNIDGILRDFKDRESIVVRIKKVDKVREIDIRPYLAELTHAGGMTLRLVLRKDAGGASVRPHDVLACLFNLSREDASLIPIIKTRAVYNTPI